jgi:hypothetical protein
MKSPNRDSLPKKHRVSGIVSLKGDRGAADLMVDETALSEVALKMLIDDWLVPTIVDRLIRDPLPLLPSSKE